MHAGPEVRRAPARKRKVQTSDKNWTRVRFFVRPSGALRLLFAHPQPFSSAKVRDENCLFCVSCWRRGAGSNRRIKVLQTSALPLGYRAEQGYLAPYHT